MASTGGTGVVQAQPPHPAAPARVQPGVYGPHRRKVTVACDLCRQRRAKCSGSLPCTYCAANQRTCTFDEKNRARRGPRPRQPAEPVIRPLFPAPRRPSAAESADTIVVEPSDAAPSTSGITVDSESDDEDSQQAGEIPPLSTWRPYVEKLLASEQGIITEVNVICHLIELYWHHSSAQLRSLLPPSEFLAQLQDGTCSKALVLAVCACHLRYSVHRMARQAAAGGLALQLERGARAGLQASAETIVDSDRILTYCFLIEDEANQGRGNRAWMDIALTKGLLQLARTRRDLLSSEVMALDGAERYLLLTELCHSIGHPSLQQTPSINRTRISDVDLNKPLSQTSCIPDLLLLLLRIQNLCWSDLMGPENTPWRPESPFRLLQIQLDKIILWQLKRPSSQAIDQSIHALVRQGTEEADEDTLVGLLWHVCVIMLNRTFLPIPVRARGDQEGSPVTTVNFPFAPSLFLEERIRTCEASAAAICTQCRGLLSRGGFFTYSRWIGFACMQSAFVLINQLHRSIEPYDQTVVENLKLSFTVLGLLRNFFSPARTWIDTVFRAHDVKSTSRQVSAATPEAFKGYFNRFDDLEEPPFVTLQELEPRPTVIRSDASGTGANALSIGGNSSTNVGDSTTSPKSGSWMQIYAGHLADEISFEDERPPAQERRPSSVPQGLPQQDLTPEQAIMPHEPKGVGLSSQPSLAMGSSIPLEDSFLYPGAVFSTILDGRLESSTLATQRADTGASLRRQEVATPSLAFEQTFDLGGLGEHIDVSVWASMMDQLQAGGSDWVDTLSRTFGHDHHMYNT
ncbi:hypothetical protein GQ53DRAFT_839712 [Thozetella sp. PMI_491]|nr:hypothetical protein GQ53DRAFT_839712 [Thozetella sp. PMI_491]